MHFLFLCFICIIFSTNILMAGSIAEIKDSIVTTGLISFIPDAPPIEKLPPKVILDESPMHPEDRFFYGNVPVSEGHSRDQATLFLKRSVHYITGIPESKIPQEIRYLPFVLKANGFSIFKLQNPESKVVQVLLANGIPLLVEMCSVKDRPNGNNKTTVTVGVTAYTIYGLKKEQPITSQEYYNVIKGYSPIESLVLEGLKIGEKEKSVCFLSL